MDYKHYLSKGIWSIHEASYLLSGFDPDFNGTANDPTGKIKKMRDLLKASQLTGKLKHGILTFRGYTGNEYGYEPKVIIKWAISEQIELPEQLQNFHQPTTPLTQPTHTSELLEIMRHCIAENWENHDPENPPSNELIKQWFTDNYPDKRTISPSIIKAMNTIMRPKKYK